MRNQSNLLSVDQYHSNVDLEQKKNSLTMRNQFNLLFVDQDHSSFDLEKKKNYTLRSEMY